MSLKDRVLTCGAGDRRAVLDYESSLVYQYDDPSNVLGYYESGRGWIIRDQPYYSSGGWGSGSLGDAEGYYLIQNTRTMLLAIDATILEVNSMKFLSKTEMDELTKSINKHNKLVVAQNKIAKQLGERVVEVEKLPELPTFKLRTIQKGKNNSKGLDAIKTAEIFKTALNTFTNQKGKTIKIENYIIAKDVVKQTNGLTRTVAFRDSKGQVFMNSEVLDLSNFERNFMGGQSLIQKTLRETSNFQIPFNVLDAANLNINETTVLEQGPESTHMIETNYAKTERHFTGALLLENAGRKFLMDIDRLEIQHGIFNPFFVEVDKSVKSIVEAYDSMKPQSVKDAEASGKQVKRQGEWFFVETGKTLTIKKELVSTWDSREKGDTTPVVFRHDISHGKGRPNSLYKPVGFGDLDSLVCGTVRHSGREHKDLNLGESDSKVGNDLLTTFQLWEVVPNTTVGNFTITGDID